MKRSVKLYGRQVGFFEETQADTPLFSGTPQTVKDQVFRPKDRIEYVIYDIYGNLVHKLEVREEK